MSIAIIDAKKQVIRKIGEKWFQQQEIDPSEIRAYEVARADIHYIEGIFCSDTEKEEKRNIRKAQIRY